MEKRTTYQELITHVDRCAKALKALGIRENDTLTIALPNCPQAIFLLYAANPMFRPGDKMLSAMPIFHGFGLGVCIHTMLTQEGCCVLVPRLTQKAMSGT